MPKTKTALLLKIVYDEELKRDTVSVEAFGYDAERRYGNKQKDLDEVDAESLDEFYLFRKFKIPLYAPRKVVLSFINN